MAKNREPIKPVESESSDDEEQSDSGDEESSSDEEQVQVTLTQTQAKKPPPPASSDDSGSETESESEEDDESDPKKTASAPPPPNPKPTASAAAEPVTPAKRPSPAEEKQVKGTQNKKKKPDPEAPKDTPKKPAKSSDSAAVTDTNSAGADGSKKLFQRIWSDEDEIVILQGMIDYEKEKNASPRSDCDAFLEFIKNNLHVDFNKTQLQHKIRRLKLKYENTRTKDKTHLLKKPHEQAVYELSDRIWGHEVATPSAAVAAKANGAVVKKKAAAENVANDGEGSVSVEVEKRKGSGCRCGLTMEDRILCRGDELFGEGSNNDEGAKEWKRLQKEDMELTLKKVDIKRAQIKLVLDNWD